MDDPDQGGDVELKKLKKQLEHARETVKACVRATEEADEGNAGGIGNAG